MKYGFRLFSVGLRRQNTFADVDFSKAVLGKNEAQEHLLDTVASVCEGLLHQTFTEPLRYIKRRALDEDELAEEGAQTKPYIRLTNFDLSHPTCLQFEFKFGRLGTHSVALAAAESDDADLSTRAPSNDYYAFLYLPNQGDRGVLVAETRSRTCPGEEVLKLLGVGSKLRDESKPSEDQIGWWKFVPQRISDSNQLEHVIRYGQGSYIELVKHAVDAQGGREKKRISVRQDGFRSLSFAEQVRALAGSWLRMTPDKLKTTAKVPPGSNPQEQLAALMDIKVDAKQFDDGGIGWEAPDGTTRHIKPDDFSDIFTYPVGAKGYGRPSKEELRLEAENVLRPLLPALKLDIDI
ncbi:MAG: hypothetical protein IIZ13_08095 [Renibacterium sp.]|nr:hypothetical protein [Renibacterium sp.]